MATCEPIRDKKQLNELARYWRIRGNLRNHALIVAGVCTALRISDLLSLTWEDVYDVSRGTFRGRVVLVEQKTKKRRVIALNAQVIKALRLYFPYRRGRYVFSSNRKADKAISRTQAWRIIRTAAEAVLVRHEHVSCHSLRKTAGYHWWKAGVLPVLLMDIFNHSSFDVTRRYLGISQEDHDSVYLNTMLF